jgi:hypothetical protein
MRILGAALRKELAAALGMRALRQDLRTELRALTREIRKLRAAVRKRAVSARASGAGPRREKRVLKLSPQRRAALKLQGQYMGYLRSLKPRQKATVKALKASKGYPAAIRMAMKLANR